MKYFLISIVLFFSYFTATSVFGQDSQIVKKDQVLDFSAGVIEGELSRPSILMELGSNFKDFDDLLFLREDFNSFHEIDSSTRLRYFEEKK